MCLPSPCTIPILPILGGLTKIRNQTEFKIYSTVYTNKKSLLRSLWFFENENFAAPPYCAATYQIPTRTDLMP